MKKHSLQFMKFTNKSSYLKRAMHKCAEKIFFQVCSSNSVDSILKPTRDKIFLGILRQRVSFIDTNRRITYLPGEGQSSV